MTERLIVDDGLCIWHNQMELNRMMIETSRSVSVYSDLDMVEAEK